MTPDFSKGLVPAVVQDAAGSAAGIEAALTRHVPADLRPRQS